MCLDKCKNIFVKENTNYLPSFKYFGTLADTVIKADIISCLIDLSNHGK